VEGVTENATPAELATRDCLLAGLPFATEIYEAPAGPNPVTVIISLAAFAAGAALATLILKASDGDQETADDKIFQAWPRRVTVALAVVVTITWVALRPRAPSGPAGGQSLPVQQAIK
jgi:hypothetical protein